MATAFHFRAIAADGKVRTGTLTAETDKLVAAELKRQGLIPVYVGLGKKNGLAINLNFASGLGAGKRKDRASGAMQR